ncbi:hypothetical protein HMPREF9176_2275 [Streptococcus downei F0415]|nr:hypothetical protein HMPREF9176_2275 [Streptococcus downei F0415]
MYLVSLALQETYNFALINAVGWFCFVWLVLPASIGWLIWPLVL